MPKGSVNKAILIGRLGGDPEVRYLPNGTAVANFSLATNRSYKDKDGNLKEETDWHRITVWSKSAEFAKNYLKKGMRVYVEGRIQYREWQDQNGMKRNATDIVSENLEILESLGDRPPADEDIVPPSDLEVPDDEAASDDTVPF